MSLDTVVPCAMLTLPFWRFLLDNLSSQHMQIFRLLPQHCSTPQPHSSSSCVLVVSVQLSARKCKKLLDRSSGFCEKGATARHEFDLVWKDLDFKLRVCGLCTCNYSGLIPLNAAPVTHCFVCVLS